MRARVEKRLEHSLDDVSVGVEVDVERRGGTYTATVDLRAVTVANDVRHLKSRRCGELADAVAVIVARVASDALAQSAGATHPTTTDAATTDAAATDAATTDAASSDAATTDAAKTDAAATDAAVAGAETARMAGSSSALPAGRSETAFADDLRDSDPEAPVDSIPRGPYIPKPWTIGARISGVSSIGVIPQIGTGAELAATFRRHEMLVELAATRWLSSSAQIHSGRPAKLDVGLDVGTVRVGWRPPVMPLRAWLAVESGTMRGTGVSLPTPQFSSERWIAAGAGFGIAWQMRPWIRLFGANETMLAIERARFSNGEGIVIYAPNPMSFRTICGLELGWQ